MYFLDNSAHIFSLPDYDKKPIGYEYDEQDYIFWFEDTNDNTRLSINNYYGKIINVLFEITNIQDFDNTSISSLYDIDITCDSENFKLIRAIDFQQSLRNSQSLLDYIDINNQYKLLSSKNDENDILIIKVTQDDKKFIMIPLYIIGTSKYSGTWLTNILIHISGKFNGKETWCPITIGGVFNDEYESLIIHGKNMGVDLPKEILKAINGTNFDNDVFDEELYNKKIKEYMLNYMSIKGECGNYESAIHSLNWFGYQDSVELYKLLETDNEFKTQYVRDYFDISQDIIKAYQFFLNSQFVGLKFKLNTETGENYTQNVNKTNKVNFWGEGLPVLTNNTDKINIKHTDEFLDDQQFKYYSSYLNYSINELMFKLSCLKYYYQKYFLPIFIILKNLHIEYKVYTTPNKQLTYTYEHLYEDIINTQQQDNDVIFPDEHNLYFTHQKHYVDEYFNEFTYIENNNLNIYTNNTYVINDTCLFIPIKFTLSKENKYKYYNCSFILTDNVLNKVIYKSNFSFLNSTDNTINKQYNGFVFYPKMIEELKNIKLYTYINKEYTLFINVNNKWYEYKFTTKLHELDIHIGTLEYQYWVNDINYLNDVYNYNSSKFDVHYIYSDNSSDDEEYSYSYSYSYTDIDNPINTSYSYTQSTPSTYSYSYSGPGKPSSNTQDNEDNNALSDYGRFIKTHKIRFKNITYTDFEGNEKELTVGDILILNTNSDSRFIVTAIQFNNSNRAVNRVFLDEYNRKGKATHINKKNYFTLDNNTSKIIFTFHNEDEDVNLDITEYIKHRDFFDYPTKYFSNFTQIDDIDEENNEIIFNTYMHDLKFIQTNNIEFGLYENKNKSIKEQNKNLSTEELNYQINTSIENDIKELVNKYRTNVNIINNYKYLNNVHLYNLYKYTLVKKYDSLHFKPNVAILCKDTLVKNKLILLNKNLCYQFTFTKSNESVNSEINTKDDYNHYLLEKNYTVKENYAWFYILERDEEGLTGRNANIGDDGLPELYNYKDDVTENSIGYLYVPININKYNIQISQEQLNKKAYDYEIFSSYEYDNIEYNLLKHALYYNDNGYKYQLLFKFEPVLKDKDTGKYISYDTNNIQELTDNVYAKLKLYYRSQRKILNLYGYYNENNCSNFYTDGFITQCSVNIENYGTIDKVNLYKSSKFVNYEINGSNEYILTEDNPSLYWSTFEDITTDDLNESNTLVTDNINTIYNININDTNLPTDYNPVYINYLCQNLIGLIGTYTLGLEEDNENVDIKVYIIRNNGDVENYSLRSNPLFILNGDEQEAVLYFVVNFNNINTNEITFIPHLYLSTYEQTLFEYNPNISNSELVDLYKTFFYNKYTISQITNSNNQVIKNIWDSYIQINDDNNYDAYLMHDNQYWYFMFISKNTCDDQLIYSNLTKCKDSIVFNDYILKHENTKQLFLINRMKVNYANNIYHFNNNEMIVCTLYNNEMLPVNMNLTSKWSIKPISFGVRTNNIIHANSNTAIISIPNGNVYDKGYYNIQVNYALDNNVLNYQTINKKILIK